MSSASGVCSCRRRPGVFSAVGLLQARLEFHAKKTYLRRLRDLSLAELRAEIAGLEGEARGLGVGCVGRGRGAFEFERFVEMRYVGGASSCRCRCRSRGFRGAAVLGERLTAAFDAEHQHTYGHRTGNEAEIVHCESSSARPIRRRSRTRPSPPRGLPAIASRAAHFGEHIGTLETPVVRRGDVGPDPAAGPFVVEDYDATTVVPAGLHARRDAADNLVIEAGAARPSPRR